jgi:hypothetical protein
VGPVDLHQKHTYFYLNKRQVSKLSQKLAKAELHGRPLRVNHDEKQREQESTQYASKKSVKAPKGIKKKFKKA